MPFVSVTKLETVTIKTDDPESEMAMLKQMYLPRDRFGAVKLHQYEGPSGEEVWVTQDGDTVVELSVMFGTKGLT